MQWDAKKSLFFFFPWGNIWSVMPGRASSSSSSAQVFAYEKLKGVLPSRCQLTCLSGSIWKGNLGERRDQEIKCQGTKKLCIRGNLLKWIDWDLQGVTGGNEGLGLHLPGGGRKRWSGICQDPESRETWQLPSREDTEELKAGPWRRNKSGEKGMSCR